MNKNMVICINVPSSIDDEQVEFIKQWEANKLGVNVTDVTFSVNYINYNY